MIRRSDPRAVGKCYLQAMGAMGHATKMVSIVESKTQLLTARAIEVFANEGKAKRWLAEPNPSLDDQKPIEVAATEKGYEVVDDLLTRIESGTFS